MGKTFAALAIAYSVATRSPRGPVIVMVPANLIDKWEQDLATFCELYLDNRRPVCCHGAKRKDLIAPESVRYGMARHSVELMRLLDDPPRRRCHLILLAQGAMSRSQTDKWVRLALISEALRRPGHGRAERLIQVKGQVHRFLAELLGAIGVERAHERGNELWKRLLNTESSAWKTIYNGAVRDERQRLDDDPVPKPVARALRRIDLSPLARALEGMPLRARGGTERVSERINAVRRALRPVEETLWKDLLSQASWRSPLLVMDEAHHLKTREPHSPGCSSLRTRIAPCEPATAPWPKRSTECSSSRRRRSSSDIMSSSASCNVSATSAGIRPSSANGTGFSSASGRSSDASTTANEQPWRCNAAGVGYGPTTATTTWRRGGHGSGIPLATSSPVTSARSWKASTRRADAGSWPKKPFALGLSATTRGLTGSGPRFDAADASTGRRSPTQSVRRVCPYRRTNCCPSFSLPVARLRQLGPLGDDNPLIFRDRTPKGRHYTARPGGPSTWLQDRSLGAGCLGNFRCR